MRKPIIRIIVIVSLLGAALSACEEDPDDDIISQFDRPQDVALVCVDYESGKAEPVPLICCRRSGDDENEVSAEENPDIEVCASTRTYSALYAFVTQTTPGEVAVVELSSEEVVDQEKRIPYNTFIPVGGQPRDIVATTDGRKVITANSETGDLSVIEVLDEETGISAFDNPALKPSYAVDLPGPARHMALMLHEPNYTDSVTKEQPDAGESDTLEVPEYDYRNQFVFVTHPTEGLLSVVALNGEYCPDNPHGCLLGWIDLREITGAKSYSPWSIVSVNYSDSIYVSAIDSPVIVEISSENLIDVAKRNYQATGFAESLTQIQNSIIGTIVARDSNGVEYEIRAFSLPQTRSISENNQEWLYAIDSETADVLAIELPPDGEEYTEEKASVVKVIDVEGDALALSLVTLSEETKKSEEASLTFNGTYAVVSTTASELVVIDVEDNNLKDWVYWRPHSIRSAVNLREHPVKIDEDIEEDTEDVDQEDDTDLPRLLSEPELYYGETLVSEEKAVEVAYFDHTDAGLEIDAGLDTDSDTVDAGETDLPLCADDGGVEFRPDYDYGFRFKCNPYEASREEWRLTWEGSINISGAGTIPNIDNPGGGPWELLAEKENTNFCAKGLYTGGDLVRQNGTKPGYGGDLLVITSGPTPVTESQKELCNNNYDENHELIFRVLEVKNYDGEDGGVPNQILFTSDVPGRPTIPLPEECFGQAVNYEIRANGHWVLWGAASKYKTDGLNFNPNTGQCEFDTDEDYTSSKMRVWPGIPFENNNFTFTLIEGAAGPEGIARVMNPGQTEDAGVEDDTDPVFFSFRTTGGFVPLSRVIGNNITDIEFTPDLRIVLVDRASDTLVLFDMLDSFSSFGTVD